MSVTYGKPRPTTRVPASADARALGDQQRVLTAKKKGYEDQMHRPAPAGASQGSQAQIRANRNSLAAYDRVTGMKRRGA